MIITSCSYADTIKIPTSKSYANRALILATLKQSEMVLKDLPQAQDVKDMLNVLLELGVINSIKFDRLTVKKSFPKDEVQTNEIQELYLGEGGTTIRFLLPLLALGTNKYLIKVNPRFKSRPHQELLDILNQAGVLIEYSKKEDELCTLKGPIKLDSINIDCTKTTQNLSAFLLIKSVFDLKIRFSNLNSSNSYVDMSNNMINDFQNCSEFSIPVDMSSASSFIALGATFKSLKISNVLKKDFLQADTAIFNVLDQIGTKYLFTSSYLEITKRQGLRPFQIDISKCLDLAPTLAFIACFCHGKSTLCNISNLKFKESNRINAIISVLDAFGAKYELIDNQLCVIGPSKLTQIDELTVSVDHRIVMMASLFFKVLGGGTINPASAVNKSFPDFFELLG